jgi:hypothetical protein
MWCNYEGWRSQPDRPNRVRLVDGTTRTGDEITDQMLFDAGWFWEELPVFPTEPQDPTTATNITIE